MNARFSFPLYLWFYLFVDFDLNQGDTDMVSATTIVAVAGVIKTRLDAMTENLEHAATLRKYCDIIIAFMEKVNGCPEEDRKRLESYLGPLSESLCKAETLSRTIDVSQCDFMGLTCMLNPWMKWIQRLILSIDWNKQLEAIHKAFNNIHSAIGAEGVLQSVYAKEYIVSQFDRLNAQVNLASREASIKYRGKVAKAKQSLKGKDQLIASLEAEVSELKDSLDEKDAAIENLQRDQQNETKRKDTETQRKTQARELFSATPPLCGPLYLDTSTLGGKYTGSPSDVVTPTSLKATGEWNDVTYVKSWRPVNNMEWFGLFPRTGQQVGIGVSVNKEVEGGIRFNANSVGIYLDSKRTYWDNAETPTGDLNQPISGRLVNAGPQSKGNGMWAYVNYDTNTLWYAHPGKLPISIGLPGSFKGKQLYAHFQAWNSNSLGVLHDKALQSYSCSSSLKFNVDSYVGFNDDTPTHVTERTLSVSGGGWNDVSSVKFGGCLKSGESVGVVPVRGAQIGIGVSNHPSKEGGIRFTNNDVGIYLDSRRTYWGPDEIARGDLNVGFEDRLVHDPKGRSGMWIKVDYANNRLWYAHPYSEPISISLPEEFKGLCLFPHVQVWNGSALSLANNPPSSIATV